MPWTNQSSATERRACWRWSGRPLFSLANHHYAPVTNDKRTRINVLVTPVLTFLVPLALVDLGLGDVALVTGFVDGAVADVGKACSGGVGLHCVCVCVCAVYICMLLS